MILNGKKIETPFISKVSFYKVFEFLEAMQTEKDEHRVRFAESLLKDLEPYPLLKEGSEDYSIVDQHPDLVERMMRLLFPPALSLNEIKTACPPFSYAFLYF
ncbi:MAG: hypothetical protein JKY48_06520 [Flavobacteriales bacterium]|nr:hypothetical protein [Flavobacteriales bacterium]